VISEVLMVGVMIFKKHEAGLDHQILSQLNTYSHQKNTAIFAVNWSQSQVFIVEVLKGLKPYTIPDNSAFFSRSKPNDLLLIPNNSTNQSFAKQYHLRIIQENHEWLLVQN
jgi:hypothetical protein